MAEQMRSGPFEKGKRLSVLFEALIVAAKKSGQLKKSVYDLMRNRPLPPLPLLVISIATGDFAIQKRAYDI